MLVLLGVLFCIIVVGAVFLISGKDWIDTPSQTKQTDDED